MTDIAVRLTSSSVPVNGLTDDPEITIQRLDTGAAVVTDDAMTDSGVEGLYTYNFTPVAGLNYSFIIDADPSVTGQVDKRFHDGSFDNEDNDLWNDHGLNPSVNKTITENTPDTDYDEAVAAPTSIDKSVTVAGSVTTINRS